MEERSAHPKATERKTGVKDEAGIAKPDSLLAWLLALTLVFAVVQITFGGVVRVTGSGDGCPDWPLCFGSPLPPLEKHALIEWSHRAAGTVVGIAALAAALRAWTRKGRNYRTAWLSAAALALVAVAGGLGGTVVLSELDPGLRALHLVVAEAVVLVTAFALAAAAWPYGAGPGHGVYGRGLARLILLASLAALLAILSGADTVWRGAGAVCHAWPLCGGEVIPQSSLAWSQMSHRIVSFVAALIVLHASAKAWRVAERGSPERWCAAAALALMAAQIVVGAANPWTGFEEWARALHLSLATMLWAALVFLLALLSRRPGRLAGEDVSTGS